MGRENLHVKTVRIIALRANGDQLFVLGNGTFKIERESTTWKYAKSYIFFLFSVIRAIFK